MPFNQTEFGKRVKEMRMIRKMTQEELASVLKVDKQQISRIERGVRACSIDLLLELSHHLNVSTDYLLMGKEPAREKNREQLLELAAQLSIIAKDL